MYYIDGNNVKARLANGVATPTELEEELIGRVRAWVERAGKLTILVFDGIRPGSTTRGTLRIEYPTPEDGDADALILRLLEGDPHAQDAQVVTNDRELARQAQDLGAGVLGADELLDVMRKSERRETKPTVRGSDEVDQWLRYFRQDPKNHPPTPRGRGRLK